MLHHSLAQRRDLMRWHQVSAVLILTAFVFAGAAPGLAGKDRGKSHRGSAVTHWTDIAIDDPSIGASTAQEFSVSQACVSAACAEQVEFVYMPFGCISQSELPQKS